METQVQQLKLNVKNIRSVLIKSNRELYGVQKDKKSVSSRIINRDKLSQKEKKLETPSKKISKNKVEKQVSSSTNPLEMLFGAGILLGAGVIVNAASGFKKVFDDFKKDNQPLFDTIGTGLNIIYNGIMGIMNSFLGPESEEGAFDWLGTFDDSGNITGGLIQDIDNAYKALDPLIFAADKALGGKIEVAKLDGVEGYRSARTGVFVRGNWNDKDKSTFESNPEKYTHSTSSSTLDDAQFDVDGSELVVTSGMGMRDLALSPGMHMGVDIAGPEGTPLVAFSQGKVVDKGYQQNGYGNYVVWVDNKGIENFYGHLKNMSTVEIGDNLTKGQIIGLMGNTGRSSGPHLHWETATTVGDTGRPKNAVLTRFNPLSKYNKLDPFKINKIPKTNESSDGKGGNLLRPVNSNRANMFASNGPTNRDSATNTIIIVGEQEQ
tara:strand:+ start:1325 stop:2629 length:1305 start_codon:yes stop_codon:yes gene_type:complete